MIVVVCRDAKFCENILFTVGKKIFVELRKFSLARITAVSLTFIIFFSGKAYFVSCNA